MKIDEANKLKITKDPIITRTEKMFKKAQRTLGLNSYKIKVHIENINNSSRYAEIEYSNSGREATVLFNRKKMNNELEDTIIHELLHLFFNKHLGVAENMFERYRKYKSLRKYREGEERAIEILASLLKKSIFSKKKKRRKII